MGEPMPRIKPDASASLLRSLRIVRSDRTERAASREEIRSASRIKLAIFCTAIALMSGLVGFWIAHQNPRVEIASAPRSARAGGPVQAAVSDELVASGYVVARRRATVAAEVTGRVVSVVVEEGQKVGKGQLLATIDGDAARAALSSSVARSTAMSAGAASVAAELADAKRILVRSEALRQSGFVTSADFTRNMAHVTSLEAQQRQATANATAFRADARAAQVELAKYQIRAPFAGVVIDQNAQPGEIISPISAGSSFTRSGICTLVDMDSLEIEVDVNEAFISKVRPGDSATATLDAYPGAKLPARIVAIVPAASREKATVKVRVALVKPDPRLLPDMGVKVFFSAKQQ